MKKLWKGLKIAGFTALALVALLLLAHAIWSWIAGSRLEAKLQALRDAGEPLTLRELGRSPIPADQNAATFLRRAQADVSAVGKELWPVLERARQEDDQRSEADNKAIRAAFDGYPQLFPLLEQAAACTDYISDLDYTADPQVFLDDLPATLQKRREVIALLAERARLQVADGKRDEALHSVVTIFRLARHLEREPAMIGHLVVCACRYVGVEAGNRVLRSGPVSAKARAELDAELGRADNTAAYVQMLKTERVIGLELYGTIINYLNRPQFTEDECVYLELMAQNIALASRTYADALPIYEKLGTETKSGRAVLASLVLSAAARTHAAHIRTCAWVRCLRVLNALQQRPATAENAPPKLADLGLPAEATIDPFNGSPLHLRKAGDEWVIYSVGKDLIDDGGQLEDEKDIGIGPIAAKGP